MLRMTVVLLLMASNRFRSTCGTYIAPLLQSSRKWEKGGALKANQAEGTIEEWGRY